MNTRLREYLETWLCGDDPEAAADAYSVLTHLAALWSGSPLTDQSEALRRCSDVFDSLGARPAPVAARLLVVDSDGGTAAMVSRIFGPEVDVVQARNGEVGVRRLALDGGFEAVICAVRTPTVDGMEILLAARRQRQELARSLIFVTNSPDRPLARLLGVLGFPVLRKPFSRSRLVALVEAARLAWWQCMVADVRGSLDIAPPEEGPVGAERTATVDAYASALVDAYIELRAESRSLPEDERADAELFKFAAVEAMRLAGRYPAGVGPEDVEVAVLRVAARVHGDDLVSWIRVTAARLRREGLPN